MQQSILYHLQLQVVCLFVDKFQMLVRVEHISNNFISIHNYVHVKYSSGVVVMEIKIVLIRKMNANEHVHPIDDDWIETMQNKDGFDEIVSLNRYAVCVFHFVNLSLENRNEFWIKSFLVGCISYRNVSKKQVSWSIEELKFCLTCKK
jgi:hypothetical protein